VTVPPSRFFLTTAIDYANGDPHLGHALEKIGADVIARYHRMAGREVHFLMGMDEHGQKVAQAAEQRGVAPHALVEDIATRFSAMWSRLHISHDRFIRTTEAGHIAGVQELIRRIFARNPDDFYEQAYSGWYCIGCEAFKAESEIVDGQCPLHPTRTLAWTEERNWFFRLSKYQSFLERLFADRPEFLQPESRRNEILGLFAEGLADVSASRARFDWGVPFPVPTSTGETQTTYVWFDALPNYLTATGFPNGDWDTRWPAQLHVVGKDITRFHTVIWPAMLEAAGLPLPERVWGHGFVSLAGERFSKSAGVKLELSDAIDRFGADAFRYFLLRDVPFDGDGSFTWERFEERYTADLANAFGNLASRVTAMVDKYRDGIVPSGPRNEVDRDDADDIRAYHAALNGSRGYLLHDGLAAVWRTIARANEYTQLMQPWSLAKGTDDDARRALDHVLASLMRQLTRQAVLVAPFLPEKSEQLWAAVGGAGSVHAQRFVDLGTIDPAGWRVTKGAGLFPRPEPSA
jgi:methionyl-tRNA synthetase